MKEGDKVKVIRRPHGGDEYIKVGDIAIILRNDGTSVPYCIEKDGRHTWVTREQVEAYIEQPDTIYLSGTPGQLKGFIEDWKAAGHRFIEVYGTERFMEVRFTPQGATLYDRAPGGQLAVPVMQHWNSLLERAKAHNSNVAPFTIAGEQVKLENDVVIIGCRKTLKASTVLHAVETLRTLNSQGAGIDFIRTVDGRSLDMKILRTLAEWLESKQK